MATKKQEPLRLPITIEIDGKIYSGEYYVEGSMVTVEHRSAIASRRTAANMASSAPEDIASILLRELVRETLF